MRGAWRLYRSAGRPLLLVAAVPELIQALLSLPSIAIAVIGVQGLLRVFGDFARFRTDPVGLQADLQAAVRPPTDLLVIAGLTGGISIAFLVIGWGAVTAAALAASEGRSVGVASAFRVVLARRAGIVLPALAVGIVWALVTAAQAFAAPTGRVVMTTSQSALYALFAVLISVVSIGAFVLAIVWSLALPAILAEGLGLRRGLARGAALTRGIRLRLGLAFIAVGLLQGLSTGIVAGLTALIGGVVARSVEVGVVVYFAAVLIGGVLWLPFLPALLTVAYRDRTAREEDATRGDGGPDVDTVPAIDAGAASMGDAG